MNDLYPQPFQIGDKVKLNPEFTPLTEQAIDSIGKIMIVKRVYWLGFGDIDDPYGCESGWIVNTDTMDGYDSHWFVETNNE